MHVITEIDAQERRAARAQRLQHRVPRPRRVLRRRRPDAHRDAATAPSSSAATARSRNPAAMARARLSGKVGRGARSLRRASRSPFELADGRGARDRLPARRGPQRRRRRQPGAALPRIRAPRAPRSTRCARTGSARSAPCRCETPDASLNVLANGWLRLPDARLPPVGAQRLLPVGRRLRLPRPAAGRDGAGPRRARARCASTCCAARPASSSKATCSTGGIRRRAAACARTARTTTSGCRSRPAATCRRPATPACSTSRSRFLEGRPVNPGDDSYYDLPGALARSRRASTSIACAPSCTACASARTACR